MIATTTQRLPLIGVMCCNRTVEGRPSQTVANRFIVPLAEVAGVSSLIVPAIPGALAPDVAVRTLDGLLLTGSCSNVSPRRYGSLASDDRPDLDRDETVARIAGAMIDAGKPVFGICRGMQEINILFGGTLDRHVDHGFSHHATASPGTDLDSLFSHAHEVVLTPGSRLAHMFGSSNTRVNSVHHQGVERLGHGLSIEALAPDGLVEGFHANPAGADVLGVQWHPEYDIGANPQSRSFFEAMGRSFLGSPLVLG